MSARNLATKISRPLVSLYQYAGKPTPGMTVQVYSTGVKGWQEKCGAGWRNLLVLKVGRKWIVMFSASSLCVVKITHKEWALLKPLLYVGDRPIMRAILERNMKQHQTFLFQYSQVYADLAMQLLEKEPTP